MTDERPIAVVLVSGGMDSCVAVAMAGAHYQVALMHAQYGQRSRQKERQAFDAIAGHYGVEASRQLIINLEHIADMGGSALTDRAMAIPTADLTSSDIPVTYVPFRNANLLAAAASWAEVLAATAIFIGAVEADSSGYPDCRREFFDAYQEAISRGTRPATRISIETPLIKMTKKEIVLKGVALGAPLALTWSCYKDGPAPCGTCDSCALRARGFSAAGVRDPLVELSGR